MGNSNFVSAPSLTFVQPLSDRYFGDVEIYRNDEGKFIMRTRQTHISQDKRYMYYQKQIEFVCGNPRGIVPIVHMSQYHEKNICIYYTITSLYTEYFNYTLGDCLRGKKEIEYLYLWFTLKYLLELVIELKLAGFAIALCLDNVFITLKGIPNVYVHHLTMQDYHISSIESPISQYVGKCVLQLAVGEAIKSELELEYMYNKTTNLLMQLGKKHKMLSKVLKYLISGYKSAKEVLNEIKIKEERGEIKVGHEIRLNKFKYQIPNVNVMKYIKSPYAQENTARLIGGKSGKKSVENIYNSEAVNCHEVSKQQLETNKRYYIYKSYQRVQKQQRYFASSRKQPELCQSNRKSNQSFSTRIVPTPSSRDTRRMLPKSRLNDRMHTESLTIDNALQYHGALYYQLNNQFLKSKLNATKLLSQLYQRKYENRLQKYRLYQRKCDMMQHNDKENLTEHNGSVRGNYLNNEHNKSKNSVWTRRSIHEHLRQSNKH